MINFSPIKRDLHTKVKRKGSKVFRELWQNLAYTFFGIVPNLVNTQRGLRILVYHGICKSQPFKLNSRFLSEQQFEAHLLLFKKHCNAISLQDFKKGNLSREKFNVLLTFDDGFKNNFTYALPLLIKHGIPALFFITGPVKNTPSYLFNDLLDVFSYIGPPTVQMNGLDFKKGKRGPHYRYYHSERGSLANYCSSLNSNGRAQLTRQIFESVPPESFGSYHVYLDRMDESEIRSLAAEEGISVGSHGLSHLDLSTLDPVELNRELTGSKHWLEKVTGRHCDSLAFPYGHYNQNTLDACSLIGFSTLFGTEKINRESDRLQVVERFTVNPHISSVNQLYYIARGCYE